MEIIIGIILIGAAYIGGQQTKDKELQTTQPSLIEQATHACENNLKRYQKGSLKFECKGDYYDR